MSYGPPPAPLVFLSRRVGGLEQVVLLSLRQVVLRDQGRSQLVAESKLELVVSGLGILSTACGCVKGSRGGIPVALLTVLLGAVFLLCNPGGMIM